MAESKNKDETSSLPNKRRSRRLIAKLGLLLAGLVLALTLTEVVLRQMPDQYFMYPESDEFYKMRFDQRAQEIKQSRLDDRPTESDPWLGWRVRPLLRTPHETTNSRGLRGSQEYRYERTLGVGRIVVLGDSFTYGFGVADEECYPAVLETLLDGYEVLNFGVNGYGTDQQLLYWLKEGVKYRPDVVLLGIYTPDFHRNMNTFRELPKPYFQLVDGSLVLRGTPVPSEAELLKRGPQTVNLGWRLPRAVGVAWWRLTDHERASSFDVKAELMRQIIIDLKKSCDNIGSKLVLVNIKHHYARYQDQDRIVDVLRRVASELDVPLLLLLRSLDGLARPGDAPRLYADNSHWTPYAHRIAARRIAKFLRSKVLSKRNIKAN